MPSRIYFTTAVGEGTLSVRVRESPNQLQRARAAAAGLEFRLTQHRDGRVLYVNPLAIAYWVDSPEPKPVPSS